MVLTAEHVIFWSLTSQLKIHLLLISQQDCQLLYSTVQVHIRCLSSFCLIALKISCTFINILLDDILVNCASYHYGTNITVYASAWIPHENDLRLERLVYHLLFCLLMQLRKTMRKIQLGIMLI